jgi:hypothetical protein
MILLSQEGLGKEENVVPSIFLINFSPVVAKRRQYQFQY